MFIDALTEVSAAQALSGAGAVLSTSSIDLKAATRLFPDDVPDFNVNVSSVSGTSPTLKVEVIGSDAADGTGNVVPLGSVEPVVATGMAAKNFRVRASLPAKRRYVSLRYTLGGTTPAMTVTAATAVGRQMDYQQA